MSEVLQAYTDYLTALKMLPADTVMPDGTPIASEKARIEKHIERLTPKPPEQCPDCKLMNNDPRCCQNDEELWK